MNSKIIGRTVIAILIMTIVIVSELYFYNKKLYIEIIHTFYTKGFIKTNLYLASYTLTLITYPFLIFTKNKILFSIFIVLTFISYYVATCYVLINGYGFGLSEMQILANEFG